MEGEKKEGEGEKKEEGEGEGETVEDGGDDTDEGKEREGSYDVTDAPNKAKSEVVSYRLSVRREIQLGRS